MCQRRRCARAPPNRPRPRQTTSEPTAHRRDGAMATTATATATATAMNARHTNRARRVRSAASARVGVRTRRRLSSASGPGGWCAVIHSNTDRAHRHTSPGRDSSPRGGISRRARIAHASRTDARAFVAPLSRISRSSNRRRRRTRGAELARGCGAYSNIAARDRGACEWVERARACRSR